MRRDHQHARSRCAVSHVGDEVAGEFGLDGHAVGHVFKGYGLEIDGMVAAEAWWEFFLGCDGVAEMGFPDAREAGDDFRTLDIWT